jgi:hypothetical protein
MKTLSSGYLIAYAIPLDTLQRVMRSYWPQQKVSER